MAQPHSHKLSSFDNLDQCWFFTCPIVQQQTSGYNKLTGKLRKNLDEGAKQYRTIEHQSTKRLKSYNTKKHQVWFVDQETYTLLSQRNFTCMKSEGGFVTSQDKTTDDKTFNRSYQAVNALHIIIEQKTYFE
eukprot:12579775-Ditylum_brightwellii.AAC.2